MNIRRNLAGIAGTSNLKVLLVKNTYYTGFQQFQFLTLNDRRNINGASPHAAVIDGDSLRACADPRRPDLQIRERVDTVQPAIKEHRIFHAQGLIVVDAALLV